MAASVRFLSAVAVAFATGVVGTGAYMSRGDAGRDVPGTTHGAAPSLSERLRAEAHGQSLPWSDPVKAAALSPPSPKLQFSPGPPEAPVEGARSATGGDRSPVLQVTPPPTPERAQDDGRGRSRIRLADRSQHARPALGAAGTRSDFLEAPRRAPAEEGGPSRARVAVVARPIPKSHPILSRHLPSLDAVDEARLSAPRPEPSRARLPARSPYRTVRLAGGDDLDVDAPPPRRIRRAFSEGPDGSSENEPRGRPHRSVTASDGLMRWLSGPGGQF
jgi:hypothetical protein